MPERVGPEAFPVDRLTFGTLPPTPVDPRGMSHPATSAATRDVLALPVRRGRSWTTPQSPVATATGIPASAAASSPGSWARISGSPWLYELSPFRRLWR